MRWTVERVKSSMAQANEIADQLKARAQMAIMLGDYDELNEIRQRLEALTGIVKAIGMAGVNEAMKNGED